MNDKLKWWQSGIIYQIYPRSFQDSNGDGIGDLQGIISRLDYVKALGVEAIWISPIFPSPMKDFGYDVSDYTGVHEIFGNMSDLEELIMQIHNRDMKVLLDLVPNHTSDQHEWFKESRSSKTNSKRDWYIWRPAGKDGGPPNNWISGFGGSSWTLDQKTGEYYLHSFTPEQPDLNYRNPEVVDAILDVIRFWLDKGVDGFRIDVICNMIKDELLRDEPLNPEWDGVMPYDKLNHIYTFNIPEVHDIIIKMRAVIDSYEDKVMIGETWLPYNVMIEYYGKNDECHLPFNFHLLAADWNASVIKDKVDEYEKALPAGCWPNYVLGNHDQPRVATRVGKEQARVALMMLLTLRGTPTVYNGEEIGMHNVDIPTHLVKDPPAVNNPEIADKVGRDPIRTPMQWNADELAGFSCKGVTPWLPLADDYKINNVELQSKDEKSMLSLFKNLSKLRENDELLTTGDYKSLESKSDDVFVYARSNDKETLIILLNFSNIQQNTNIALESDNAKIILSTKLDKTGDIDLSNIKLCPNEGIMIRL
jgi:alpha-glucosidase